MGGKRNRDKGQEYERRIAHELEAAIPGSTWRRRVQFRGGRVDGSDIEGTIDGRPIPLWLEMHNGKSSGAAKLRQATGDAPEGWHPIAVIHRPGTRYESDMAWLDFADLAELGGLQVTDPDPVTVHLYWRQLVPIIARWVEGWRA